MRLTLILALLFAGSSLAPAAHAQAPSGASLERFLVGKTFKYQQKGWDRYYWWEVRFYPGGQATSRAEGLKTAITLRWHVRRGTLCMVNVAGRKRFCYRVLRFHPNQLDLQNLAKPAERFRLIRCYLRSGESCI